MDIAAEYMEQIIILTKFARGGSGKTDDNKARSSRDTGYSTAYVEYNCTHDRSRRLTVALDERKG